MVSIEKIRPTRASALLSSIGNVFIVVVMIFALNRSLFFSIQLWQLVGLSVGLAFGSLMGNIIYSVVVGFDQVFADVEEREVYLWTCCGIYSATLLSLVTFIFYLCHGSLRWAWITVGIVEIAISLIYVFTDILPRILQAHNKEVESNDAEESFEEET